MKYDKVIKYQEELAEKYKYKPIPPMFREDTLKFYKDNLPELFSLNGDNVPLFSPGGLMLCNRYNRIVIGDYGAFVEILPEDIIHENIKVKKGQEYRDFDERYSKRVKYSWLTANDNSDIKIYFQKKKVDYADYVPGRYYISPYECSFSRVLDKDGCCAVFREKIAQWLKKQGVSAYELLDYYENLSSVHGNSLNYAIEHDLFPGDFEYWVRLNEICEVEGGLSYEQFVAVRYNLTLIACTSEELKGKLSVLTEDIRTAIQLGLEGFPLPPNVEMLKPAEIRMLLNMSCKSLLCVSHLSKVLAGCKVEEVSMDIDNLIVGAEERAGNRLVGAALENTEKENTMFKE